MRKSTRGILTALLTALCLLGAACSKPTADAPKTLPDSSEPAAPSSESKETPIPGESENPTVESSGNGSTSGEAIGSKSPGNGSTSGELSGNSLSDPSSQLSRKAQELCGIYFKAGDFSYRLELIPGMPTSRSNLTLTASKRNLTLYDGTSWSSSMLTLHEWELPYQDGVSSFSLTSLREDDTQGSPTAVLNGEVLTLQGSGEADGAYYPIEGNLMMPDAFFRPLNDTDLIGLKASELRLVRNELYAVYGRKFTAQDLSGYFGAKPWYQGRLEPDQFDEGLFGGLVKRNIAFLMKAEEHYDEQAAAAAALASDALPDAPYLSLLPEHGEILVTISPDRNTVTDKGIYYIAKGSIQVPITITPQQYNALHTGETLEITVNELTGEKNTLTKGTNTDYGEFYLGEEAYGDYVSSSYDPESGVYTLWANSADTRFKPVYEGDIYVLKGATEEYYRHFESSMEQLHEAPGVYRVIDFNEPDNQSSEPYSGNILVTNDKGYVKALYFWGD